jgi:signal transduction histidine kinase
VVELVEGEDALLVLAPEGRDAAVLHSLLIEAGISAEVDESGEILFDALEKGTHAGAVMTDEALTRVGLATLREAVERQPTWSDFPFVILARRGDGERGALRHVEQALNATVLERPLHPTSLVSAARSAIRGRERQRLTARQLRDLEKARGELRSLAESLETKVSERTRDLASANDRLTAEIAEREKAEARLVQAQKMEAMGQLTGGVAHDFNNLLTAVVGSLDLLLRRIDDEKLRRLANNALQAGERGAQLTSQLLAFARRQRLSPSVFSPNQVISGMGDLLARTIGPQIQVEMRLEPNLWHALADPTQFEVMVLNLSINARDAMRGGGRLTIGTANVPRGSPQIAPDLHPGDYVAISVSDTGDGMTPDVLSRAFEPFFTTKDPGQGTGLGLSQLYGFAKQSGGSARIDSAPREGTTVTVYLPRSEAHLQAVESPGTLLRQSGRLPVLLVDDDDAVREVCTAMLEDIGWTVIPAAGGGEALTLLREQEFAALLTDVAMPGMSGVELAAHAREIRPGLPILFASGYADLDSFGKQLSDEVVLKKPYRLTDLAERLAATVDDPREKVVPLAS